MREIKKIKESELIPCFCTFCPECGTTMTAKTLGDVKEYGMVCYECGAVYEIEEDKS